MLAVVCVILLLFGYCSSSCTGFNDYRTRVSAEACYKTAAFSNIQTSYRQLATDMSGGSNYYLDLAVYRQTMKAGPRYFRGTKVDLTSGMEVLKTKSFSGQFFLVLQQLNCLFGVDWYTAEFELNRLLGSTRDGHFSVSMNTVFGATMFYHPVGISSSMDGNTQKFYFSTTGVTEMTTIQAKYNSAYSTSHDFSSLHGQQITMINGKDPKSFIKEICDGYSSTRDDSSCLNDMVRYLWWKRTYAPRLRIPTETYTYTYGSNTIELDFVSCINSGGSCLSVTSDSNYLSYLNTYKRRRRRSITPKKETPKSRDEDLELRGLEKARILREEIASGKAGRRAPSRSVICTYQCATGSQHSYTMYSFSGVSDTAVLYFSGMTSCATMVTHFKDCLKNNFAGGPYTKLVLDLRENGGGTIFWGMYVISGLIRKTMPHTDYYLGAMVWTKKSRDYFSSLSVGNIVWNNAEENVRIRECDGSVSTYAPYFWWNSGVTTSHVGSEASTPLKTYSSFSGFEPENFIMLLDGSCGSTCGMMANVLTGTKSARTLILGGFAGDDFDITSFEGSGIYTVNDVYNTKDYSYSWGAYSVPNYDGMYDKSKMDYAWSGFTVVNADHREIRFDQFEVSNDDGTYDAFNYFTASGKKCASWNVKIDGACSGPVTNGIYGRPCVNGEWSTTQCTMKRCDDGYYMDEAKTKCTLIGSAPLYSNFCFSCADNATDIKCGICKDGYFGPVCSVTTCFGVMSNSSDSCGTNGTCTEKDTCSCNSNYFGVLCNITTCNAIQSNQTDVCSSHGTCLSFDYCDCEKGYSGYKCDPILDPPSPDVGYSMGYNLIPCFFTLLLLVLLC